MSISSLVSNIWSSATTALTTPQPSTVAVSAATTTTSGTTSGTTATTTGATDPFAQLGQDLQAWLTQLQAADGTDATTASQSTATATGTATTHHHHHHHDASQGTQTDGDELQQDLSKLVADLKSGQPTSGNLSQALQSYATAGSLGGSGTGIV